MNVQDYIERIRTGETFEEEVILEWVEGDGVYENEFQNEYKKLIQKLTNELGAFLFTGDGELKKGIVNYSGGYFEFAESASKITLWPCSENIVALMVTEHDAASLKCIQLASSHRSS